MSSGQNEVKVSQNICLKMLAQKYNGPFFWVTMWPVGQAI